MTWTAKHDGLLREYDYGEVKPSGSLTPEQALNLAVDGFRHLCDWEGVEHPTEAEIREHLTVVL